MDKASVVVLTPIWAICLFLALATQMAGGGVPLVGLSPGDRGGYPALNGEFSSLYAADPLESAGLRAGDLLVRVGGADLRGVGTLGFLGLAREQARGESRVPILYERSGERRTASLLLSPVSVFRPWLALSFSFAASALFLLLRARPTATVRSYFYAAFCLAIGSCFFAGDRLEVRAWTGIFVFCMSLLLPLLFRFFFFFPDDRRPKGRWHRIWPWCFGSLGVASALFFSGRMTVGQLIADATMALGTAAFLVVATTKYRSSDAVARRQIRWALFGLYFFLVPVLIGSAIAAFDPRYGSLKFLGLWIAPLFPLSLLVSVARFNLFDIDRLLSAAASYNVLIVLVAGGGLIVVPRIAATASHFAGVDPVFGQVTLSMLLAALVVPAHHRLRPQIDRVFFKERYALDHGMATLLPRLSACTDTEELTREAGAGIHHLFRPDACVVYASVGGSYVPVFVEGRAVPPAFDSTGPLIGTLRNRSAPLALGDAGRQPDEAPLGPFDRAALETLDAEVIMPVRLEDTLAAFLCLGPKRSGDVYTSTDLSHLMAITQTVSNRLLRFDQEDVARESQAMQESLRRYVPGAVAEQLSSGKELASGEREVSVMFVDLRGYTTFAEGRRAEEIFSTVNHYTETVSEIVQKHGGSVVEFNGDGMMAVFGAPRELALKERAAVEAGSEILAALQAHPLGASGTGRQELPVGVGIATGVAFVGNIRAVDRMIWSAIGNPTNLAARLQALTRDLDTALVIDAATRHAIGTGRWVFEKHESTVIRGRSRSQDIYTLSIPPARQLLHTP